MYSEDISDVRKNVRALLEAATYLHNLVGNIPESSQPSIVAVYNALLNVIHSLNQELADEEDDIETITLPYLEENGISASLAFQNH